MFVEVISDRIQVDVSFGLVYECFCELNSKIRYGFQQEVSLEHVDDYLYWLRLYQICIQVEMPFGTLDGVKISLLCFVIDRGHR